MSEVAQARAYIHPGRAFAARYGVPQSGEDVLRYADFLRQETGLSADPPVDLSCIYRHFGIRTPRLVSLSEQQGLLVNDEIGMILIKEDDPVTRRRFSEAHELMELLFSVQEEVAHLSGSRPYFADNIKERLCEQGAAALLMPQSSFLPRLRKLGVTLSTGTVLANLYRTSLLATLFQMVQQGPGAHALVLWRAALKPTQISNLPPKEQLSFLSDDAVVSPEKKLRVWWAACTEGLTNGFIPKHKSVPRESLIHWAYATGITQNGTEYMNLGKMQGIYRIEASRIALGDEWCVLSLLHLSGDHDCSGR